MGYLNSAKGQVVKLLRYHVWGRILANVGLLKTLVNFYIDLKEFSLVSLCLILNSVDFSSLKKKEKSKLHIKGKKIPLEHHFFG